MSFGGIGFGGEKAFEFGEEKHNGYAFVEVTIISTRVAIMCQALSSSSGNKITVCSAIERIYVL